MKCIHSTKCSQFCNNILLMYPEVVNANTTRKKMAVLYMKEITIYFFIASI